MWLRISAYDRLERGTTLQAQFPLLALGTPLPYGYLAAIENIWSQSTICGAAPFAPARVYVAESIAGTTTRYRGIDAQGHPDRSASRTCGSPVDATPASCTGGNQDKLSSSAGRTPS